MLIKRCPGLRGSPSWQARALASSEHAAFASPAVCASLQPMPLGQEVALRSPTRRIPATGRAQRPVGLLTRLPRDAEPCCGEPSLLTRANVPCWAPAEGSFRSPLSSARLVEPGFQCRLFFCAPQGPAPFWGPLQPAGVPVRYCR